MSFALDIKKFAEKAGGNANRVIRKTILELSASIITRTPVGNPALWEKWNEGGVSANTEHWLVKTGFVGEGYVGGHARANWSHSVGSLNPKEFKAIDENEGESNVSYRRIERTVHAYGSDKNAADNVHFIQTSLPYIQALEDGHSTQAPHGMVGLAAVEFQSFVDKAVGELR